MTEAQGPALLTLFHTPGVLDILAAQDYSVALALEYFDEHHVQVAQLLNTRGIPLIGWLVLPLEESSAFNAQNYPQAVNCYQTFRYWAVAQDLRFEAIGLEIAPPSEVLRSDQPRMSPIIHRLWRARENALYFSARTAYADLIATIHRDGYEVHTYQMPLIADDQRAGTTLIQRTLDIVDLPTDLDVLMCSSSIPIERLGGDLEGALITCYGPGADAIGVGEVSGNDQEHEGEGGLLWPAFCRDLLLAAHHTDTIYIHSLEGCVAHGLLLSIAALDWRTPVRAATGKVALVAVLRWLTFGVLLGSRFGPRMLAWTGWVVAVILWLRGRRLAPGIRRQGPGARS